MKVLVAPPVLESLGVESTDSFTPWDQVQDKLFGKKGTYRRYKMDRDVLYLHIRDTFVDFLLWPLGFLPWGHVAGTFWFSILTEHSFYGALDGLSFSYFGDKFVVGLRDALRGKRHHQHTYMTVPSTKGPYIKNRNVYTYPLWLLTRIVWPSFKEVREVYLGNK